MIDDQDQATLRMQVGQLNLEHGDYHTAIDAMIAQACDPLSIQRMKKKKLELKDRLEILSSRIIPDQPA